MKIVYKILSFFQCLMLKTYPSYLIFYFVILIPAVLVINGFLGVHELLKEKEFTKKKFRLVSSTQENEKKKIG